MLILAGVVTVVSVVVAAPQRADLSSAGKAPDAAHSGAWDKSQAASLTTEHWSAGEVELAKSSDGHFYADVSVDGAPAHMLVDTGASVVALTGEDAESLGLTWDASQVRPVAQGAGGVVYGLPVTLDQVSLGDLEVRNVDAIVVPEGLGISLLGQSFLGRIDRVEINDGTMILGN